MALIEYTFEVTITVKTQVGEYTETRSDTKQGCNHVDNISGVCGYMGQRIRERIQNNRLEAVARRGEAHRT